MLIWSTQFPVLSNRSVDDLIELGKKWLCGSPHYGWQALEMPVLKDGELCSCEKENQTFSIAKVLREAEEYGGFSHRRIDQEGREWVTEVCGWHTSSRFIVGIFLHCSTTIAGVQALTAKKPYIVKQILGDIGGDLDGCLQVTSSVHVLRESDLDTACSIINKRHKHCLPIIYVSSTWENCPAFDVAKLAQCFQEWHMS